MKRAILIIVMCLTGALTTIASAKSYQLTSPDGKNVLTVTCDAKGLAYSLARNGEYQYSTVPFTMKVGDAVWGTDAKVRKVSKGNVNGMIQYVVPRKYKEAPENYNWMKLGFKGYDVEFRAYNDGVAYRFLGKKDTVAEIDESAGYRFAKDYNAYALMTKELQNWYEEDYTIAPLSALPKDMMSLTPLMVTTDNSYLLFAEADLYDYSGSYLRPVEGGFDLVWSDYPLKEKLFDGTNKLYAVERYDYIVKCNVARTFPWRVVGTFDKGAEIDMMSSDLIYLLSEKTAEDYSWVKPGKVLWDWWNNNNIYGVDFKAGINTATYMYMVDYAAAHGFEYILIDEGWSGRDDLLTLNPETDIPAVCRYAQGKGVGVCLWAKWINVDRQLDEAFDLMKSWGVKGVKIDFMDRNDAIMVNFYERVARKATECRMLVDFHGSYPNEGMRAKYPNLMTREGVVGLEYNKWSERATPEHQLIIPYLRQWVGPMDFTPGSMLNAQKDCFRISNIEPMSQGTRCHHMAMYVVYESPLQMLSDSPTKYDENPQWLPFLEIVPSVWDETFPLWGQIGKNIAVARRSGDRYFVGAMSAGAPEAAQISLDFLPEGEWVVKCYEDGLNAEKNGKDYRSSSKTVTNKDVLAVGFASNGGFVAVFEKR